MRIERASYKAVKYATLKFHYAKRIPAHPIIAYNVFENKVWCGCIVFNAGIGAIEKPFGLKKGEVSELVRVALNGKQSKTSKCVSRAVKIFKKDNPLCKLLVSYADTDKGHQGTIYKAMNWIHISTHKTGDSWIDKNTGKEVHSRSHSKTGFSKQFGNLQKVRKTSELKKVKKGPKHKFIYWLDKRAKKEYTKNAMLV